MKFLQQLKQLFDDSLVIDGTDQQSTQKHIEQAAATLLFEMCRADFNVADIEKHAVLRAVVTAFELSLDDAKQLMDEAETIAESATSLHQYTALINQHWGLEEKHTLLTEMWRIAFADGNIDKYEEYYVRKIADLLHLPHKTFIQTKLTAQQMQELI